MSNHESPSIAGKLDRVTGKPASIYTPPEDLVDGPNVPVSSGARLARYAEAIDHEACRAMSRCNDVHKASPSLARAVMAVADQETAELRAEVERLRGLVRVSHEDVRAVEYLDRAEAAEAKLSDPWDMDGNAAAQAWRRAAEAESARLASEQRELAAQVAGLRSVVARVEALADKWEAYGSGSKNERVFGRQMVSVDFAVDKLRTALASVGVSGSADDRQANASQAPDTATPGEVPPECLTHAHIPWNNWCTPASSADDKAGE